ncbi:MAG: D-Ala-D-Ala carboxypeptidase family metallohydrolase [Bacteroidaceae bacterium]|nr:D-Ala-D-Ala carboxypeptidase family metallohydrolase [Bacteroidaceae bacterium]
MQITEHFKLSEFERSETAKRLGIDNSVPKELLPNIKALCEKVLEPLRAEINKSPFKGDRGGLPVIISSGYRCPALNRAVGGADKSQHMKGEAVDIHLPSIETGRKWLTFILENLRFDQLIWEHDTHGTYWIHVSLCINDADNRQKYIPNMVKVEKKV